MKTDHPFTRYLAAKKSVDDRSLNHHVWETLVRTLRGAEPGAPLRVLEVGAGIGTMVERLVERGLFSHVGDASPAVATITAIDAEPENIDEARRRLPRWAADRGFSITDARGGLVLARPELRLTLELEAIDLFELAVLEHGRPARDLLIAQAVLDQLDVPAALAALIGLVRPGGLVYFPITFDGGTIFQPTIDRAFDDQVESLHHRTMDQSDASGNAIGDSRAGRHLFRHLWRVGAEVLASGGSDWVVVPGLSGYAADEAYFLHFIVRTVHAALERHPRLDRGRFGDWIAERHAQIERGELVYVAHQLDVLARTPRISG